MHIYEVYLIAISVIFGTAGISLVRGAIKDIFLQKSKETEHK